MWSQRNIVKRNSVASVFSVAENLFDRIRKLSPRTKKGTDVIPVPRGREKRSGGETAL